MNEGMKQAAESGDINALHQLIGEDVNLLDHIDHVQCVQTPLHIATSAGHIQFSTEMMGLKPSFAWKLNPNGFSPIHLALKNGHIELVRQLLEIDRNLAHVKGNECINPLHYVVETGDRHIDLLENFLLVCPDSITDVTVRDETALHIALKNDQLEAFKFLVGWLGRNFCKNSSSIFKHSSSNVKAVLDQKDDEGNTVLHITVSKNQTQVVSHILTWGFRFIDVNSTNLEDKTTWDISQGQTQVDSREIRLMLHSAGPSSGSALSIVTRSDDNNIDEFYNLIGEDVKLLEHIDMLPLANTPLHIATSYGNIQFALETTSLKPSFARKLNQNGFSPIHLALKNEHIELVRRLLQIDGNLVRVKGKECLTPLHYVAKSCSENLDLLKEFLLVCPDSITDVTVRNETALHIALKYNRLKTFKFIMRWLARNCTKIDKFNVRTTLNWKDNEGNTVLHIAVSKNQTQASSLH
ncbi:ankyrin repeat-containing protein bda1 [Quercus suber]|uniref:Ankyrin repeat-containing protein bda1 n=1 Tax=Quercus suber TaxID=58331 RepID=A0AAW0K9G8_QUESU